jgi:predicted membrane-bound mannosyltransferase/DNA-binding beta-propeller fold protein YncE
VAEATLGRRRAVAAPFSTEEAREWVLAHLDVVILGGLIIAAAMLRFWDLGDRALHHDESLHATFSWYFYDGKGFKHDPLMHGPFQFHMDAAFFFLFGDNDYTARMPHALFGTMLVALPWLLRNQIGTKAALIAAAFFAFSPTLLYYSRFDREDAYDMFWTTAMVVCMWRYLDAHGRVLRDYFTGMVSAEDERGENANLWLYALAAVTALSYATKETTFIEIAVILVFIDIMLAIDLGRRREGEEIDRSTVILRTIGYLPFAWVIAALWPLLGTRPFDRDRLPPAGDIMVVLGTLSLPQFAAGVQALPFIGNKGYFALSTITGPTPEDNLRITTVLVLLIASVYVGLLWKPKTWGIAAACFYVPYILLFTTFFTNQPMPWTGEFWHGHGGFFSGIWGSLDYWLDQQDVNRGSQPGYYYALLTPLYEFLPLVLAVGGAAWMVLKGDALKRFLLFWLVGVFAGLSLAGEKMPWLETYIAIPLALIGAVVLAKVIDELDFQPSAWARTAGLAAIGILGALCVATGDSGGLHIFGALLLAAGLLAVVGTYIAEGWRPLARAALTFGIAVLATFSVRAATMASFQHGDIPVEMLVYTQTSPEIPQLMDRIDALAKTSKLGYNLPIVVDATDGFSWPWAWYLRHYHEVQYPTISAGYVPPANAVLLVAKSNATLVDGSAYETQPYKHRWWFIEESYRGLNVSKLRQTLTSTSRLDNLLDFWVHRRSDTFTGSVDAVAFFPSTLSSFDVRKAPPAPAPPPAKLEDGRIAFGKLGTGQGQFIAPSDAFVDKDGNIWVADTNNNRIQKFDKDGRFIAVLGGGGTGPGRFNQPWSVVVDNEGFVYVADTWNHRIQKFGPDLKYIAGWGQPYYGDSPGPFGMFGPRDVVIGPDGTLWVSDTGNKRIVNYTRDGEFIRSVGTAGSGPGQLSEGVGIAFDRDGRLLVANDWNSRIERFSADFSSATSFPAGWTSQDAIAKPYLAVLADGRIVASEPAKGYLMLFDRGGAQIGTWKPAEGSRPIGVAALPDGGFVFTDAARNEAQIVPADNIVRLFK